MIEWPNAYIGIPYAELNCWQLAVRILHDQAGIELPSYAERYTTPREVVELAQLIAEERAQAPWRKVDTAQALDIVVAWIRSPKMPAHVGIVTEPGMMLTTHEPTGCVLVQYKKGNWEGRVAGIYRHEALEC